MQAFRSRIVSQRHLAWLLWLALLIPAAQAAANWHAYSHVAAAAGSEGKGNGDNEAALHASHCGLCLAAAAVAGGALLVEPLSLHHPAARHAAPPAVAAASAVTARIRAYLSRAPPSPSH
jgi:hypothetical protein